MARRTQFGSSLLGGASPGRTISPIEEHEPLDPSNGTREQAGDHQPQRSPLQALSDQAPPFSSERSLPRRMPPRVLLRPSLAAATPDLGNFSSEACGTPQPPPAQPIAAVIVAPAISVVPTVFAHAPTPTYTIQVSAVPLYVIQQTPLAVSLYQCSTPAPSLGTTVEAAAAIAALARTPSPLALQVPFTLAASAEDVIASHSVLPPSPQRPCLGINGSRVANQSVSTSQHTTQTQSPMLERRFMSWSIPHNASSAVPGPPPVPPRPPSPCQASFHVPACANFSSDRPRPTHRHTSSREADSKGSPVPLLPPVHLASHNHPAHCSSVALRPSIPPIPNPDATPTGPATPPSTTVNVTPTAPGAATVDLPSPQNALTSSLVVPRPNIATSCPQAPDRQPVPHALAATRSTEHEMALESAPVHSSLHNPGSLIEFSESCPATPMASVPTVASQPTAVHPSDVTVGDKHSRGFPPNDDPEEVTKRARVESSKRVAGTAETAVGGNCRPLAVLSAVTFSENPKPPLPSLVSDGTTGHLGIKGSLDISSTKEFEECRSPSRDFYSFGRHRPPKVVQQGVVEPDRHCLELAAGRV